MTKKKLSKTIICIIVSASFIGFILLTLLGLAIGMWATEIGNWTPDYEMVDISPILEKSELSDEDYNTLYRQTGLTKLGVDRMLDRGSVGKSRILNIQENFFGEYEVKKYRSFILCEEYIDRHVTHAYLENGDILVSSTAHLSGVRFGHSALVVNANSNEIIEATSYGELSSIGTSTSFTTRANFMLFSPKVDTEIKEQVVEYAADNLVDLKYSALVGIFSKKNKIKKTQCAHLVWSAYNAFGIDLDSNGGGLVVPRDMANSPKMELVQVFGMDIDKLWN